MALSQDLLDVIACPKCKGDLELSSLEDWFICHTCNLKYPIRDEIPIMLIEEATVLPSLTQIL